MCFKSNQYPRFSLCPKELEGSVKQGLCNCPPGFLGGQRDRFEAIN